MPQNEGHLHCRDSSNASEREARTKRAHTPALPLQIVCHLLGFGDQLHPTGLHQPALQLSHRTLKDPGNCNARPHALKSPGTPLEGTTCTPTDNTLLIRGEIPPFITIFWDIVAVTPIVTQANHYALAATSPQAPPRAPHSLPPAATMYSNNPFHGQL